MQAPSARRAQHHCCSPAVSSERFQCEESSLNPPFRGFQVEIYILSKPLAKNIFLKFGFLKSESFSSNVRLAAGATGKMLVCHAPTKKASLFTQQMRGPTVPVSMKLWRNWKGEMGSDIGYGWIWCIYIMCTHLYIYIYTYSGLWRQIYRHIDRYDMINQSCSFKLLKSQRTRNAEIGP